MIMMVIWTASTFDYYLISYMVNGFKEVYTSAFVAGCSEVLAFFISGVIYKKLGMTTSLKLAFATSTIGGSAIILWGLDH